jgi:hypothetical protein
MEEECGTLALCDICSSCFLFPRVRDVWEEGRKRRRYI